MVKNKKEITLDMVLKKCHYQHDKELLNRVKKELLKHLNKSNFNEAFAKCVVDLVFEKELQRIKV